MLTTIRHNDTGKLVVADILPFDGDVSPDALLALAASAESRSEHPLGRAILAEAEKRQLHLTEVTAFRMAAGKGVSAHIDGQAVYCGKEAFLAEHGLSLPEEHRETVERLYTQGKACVLVAQEGRYRGVIALADLLRPEAADTVSQLTDAGIDSVLLTGDNRLAAAYFAEQAGISAVYAELLPQQKVESITALQAEGKTVCMVGDGVNDAPALAAADVGVAMGGIGSDMTVQKIAQEVGYEDVKFFNQLFRRKLKMSPGEFRKMSL